MLFVAAPLLLTSGSWKQAGHFASRKSSGEALLEGERAQELAGWQCQLLDSHWAADQEGAWAYTSALEMVTGLLALWCHH